MTLAEQTYAQAMMLSGIKDAAQAQLLQLYCRGCTRTLLTRLRAGLSVDDCKADFVASAALYALAALSESDELAGLEHLQVGDLTVKRTGNTAAKCLRNQADMMMSPYVQDKFCFRRV